MSRPQTPAWAKELPPSGVAQRQCAVTVMGRVCDTVYLDYPGGREAHKAVFGHWPEREAD